MDHLPVLDHPRPVRVKYREHSTYSFDQEGFLGFPERKNIDEKALVDRGPYGQLKIDGHPRFTIDAFRVFVQAWLFWGLLSEFMLPPHKVDFEHFLEDDEVLGRRITTKNLMACLASWRDNFTTIVNRTYFMRLNLVLTTAKAVVRSFSANALGNTKPVLPFYEDCIAIGVLGETLQWALIEAQKFWGLSPAGWCLDDGRGWGLTMYDRNDLARYSICPSEFVFLEGLLKGSVCGFYYATSLKGHASSESSNPHHLCDTRHCAADEVVGPYRTRHVVDCDGSCAYLEPDQRAIASTVMDGGIPVLDYIDYPCCLKVKRYEHGLPYVVVSHIWADGLGSPEGNAMLACQMKRLATLVGKFSDFHGQRVGFWIDSICVPVEHPVARDKAIGSMYTIYADAYATIVLSADLMDIHAGQTRYLEPAMRIATSKWMRRLWTFQEGVMRRNLYFLFADGLKNIEDLEVLYPRAASESVIAFSARSFYTNLLRPRNFKDDADVAMVISVYRAVQWRTTTRADDECRALARVLNINDPRLTNRLEKDQMEILLKRLSETCSIPSGLMFMAGARLERSPFRWAPATWMLGSEPEYPDPLLITKASQLPSAYSITVAQSVLTNRGLLVRYPGFRLHCTRKPEANDGERFHVRFPTDFSLRHWYELKALNLSDEDIRKRQLSTDFSGDMTDLGIICCRPNPGIVEEVAILVSILNNSNGTIHCRWLDLAKINLINHDRLIPRLNRLFTTHMTDPSYDWNFGEILGADQLWTAD